MNPGFGIFFKNPPEGSRVQSELRNSDSLT